MTKVDRFVDVGKHLGHFADEVWVRCANCDSPGVAQATLLGYRWNARFECNHCSVVLNSAASDWVGSVRLYGRRPCGYCGHQWLTPSQEFLTSPVDHLTQLSADCPTCERQTLVQVALMRVASIDRDPHFGLPLRFITNTRHGTVWAYNLKHLDELSRYVGAKLRERQGAGNGSMFSRLPKWMKLAKHREEIVKALGKLSALA